MQFALVAAVATCYQLCTGNAAAATTEESHNYCHHSPTYGDNSKRKPIEDGVAANIGNELIIHA